VAFLCWAGALLGALLLVGCTPGRPGAGTAGEDARKALADSRSAGPILTIVQGNPFNMDEMRRDALVTNAMARGVAGLDVRFSALPSAAAAPEPHLVVILDPQSEPPPAEACGTPQSVPTTPASETLKILAAFCDHDRALNVVREEGPVSGPTDARFERLFWRTAAALFPDTYWDTYGFGILPRWINLGIGGSFGF
jgi:hypothetical protein